MKNKLPVVFVAAFLTFGFCASSVFAQTATSTDLSSLITDLEAQIKALQARINELETELGVKPQTTATAKDDDDEQDDTEIDAPGASIGTSIALPSFTEALAIGSRGDDVRNLQTFLAQFPNVYPEGLITSYFGPLTEKAVQRWQTKHNIITSGTSETTGYGRIGPKTRARLNEFVSKTKEEKKEEKKIVICHIPSGNPENKATIEIGESALKAHLVHGDYEGSCDGNLPPPSLSLATTTPSTATTTPPVIPPLTPTASTTPSTATTTPSGTVSATPATPASPATPAVPPSTGSNTTTTPATPATPATPTTTATTTPTTSADTTAPVISNVQSFSYSSWGKITWNTNENTDGKVEYGLTTSYGTSAASSTLETYHAIYLPSLSANTTYHYRIISKDATGNAATSGDYTFTSAMVATSPPPPPSTTSGVTILVPNGGEQWVRGSTYEVRWSHALQDSNFRWRLVVQGSVSLTSTYDISGILPLTQSSFLWTVPSSLTTLPSSSAYKMAVQLWKSCVTSPCLDQSDLLPSNNQFYLLYTYPIGWGDDSNGTFTIASSSSVLKDTNSSSLASILHSLAEALNEIEREVQRLLTR